MATPTDPQLAAMTQAVIYKAVRFLKLPESPLGTWGDFADFGPVTVRPDHTIAELLYGLRFREWDVNLDELVTWEDVARVGLETDPGEVTAEQQEVIERAIGAAVSWVAHYLLEGAGIA